MAHNPHPFTHDSPPDLTAAILGVVNESHTRAQLEKMSITRLRELLKQYTAKPGSGRELADIRGLLRAKGAGSVLDEESACERAAAKRLRDANAADLKEKPGAAGAAAHKRLHKTIGAMLKKRD